MTVPADWRRPTGGRAVLSSSSLVAGPAVVSHNEFPAAKGTPADIQNFYSQPALHPPAAAFYEVRALDPTGRTLAASKVISTSG